MDNKNIPSDPDLRHAWESGYRAYSRGITVNPYSWDSPEYQAWDDGYSAAARE